VPKSLSFHSIGTYLEGIHTKLKNTNVMKTIGQIVNVKSTCAFDVDVDKVDSVKCEVVNYRGYLLGVPSYDVRNIETGAIYRGLCVGGGIL
jgi:hypothetical protein